MQIIISILQTAIPAFRHLLRMAPGRFPRLYQGVKGRKRVEPCFLLWRSAAGLRLTCVALLWERKPRTAVPSTTFLES